MEIKKIYNEVVTGCNYDIEVASKHNREMISSDVKASDLPHIEANFVAQNRVGCCLHYGMTLFAKLREQNIECYIAITKEENPNTHQKTDNHVSVCYLKNGRKYIADPVETVKTGKGEYFDIPKPDDVIFTGWFSCGEVFRSGCTFHSGYGKIFYFQPGHEEYPVYYIPEVQKVIRNAVHWCNPTVRKTRPLGCDNVKEVTLP